MNRDHLIARLEQRFAQLSTAEQENVLRMLRLAISTSFQGANHVSEFHQLIKQLDASQLEAAEFLIDQQQKKDSAGQ